MQEGEQDLEYLKGLMDCQPELLTNLNAGAPNIGDQLRERIQCLMGDPIAIFKNIEDSKVIQFFSELGTNQNFLKAFDAIPDDNPLAKKVILAAMREKLAEFATSKINEMPFENTRLPQVSSIWHQDN